MAVAERTESVMTPAAESELVKHPGSWAALSGGEIVAIGVTPADVIAAARKKGATDLALYRIPTEEEAHAAYY